MKLDPFPYTAEIADYILGELRAGRALLDICRDEGMPSPDTVQKWVRQNCDGFAGRYRQAREMGQGTSNYLGTTYTREIADRFLDELMNGRTLVEVCRDPDMPDHTTICRWVASDRDGFAERYRCARYVGRLKHSPVPYNPEVADRILDGLMAGQTLADICAEPDMPSSSTIQRWIKDNLEGFAEHYWQAREIGCYTIFDQSLGIVDDRGNDWIVQRRQDGSIERILDSERVNRARLRVNTRRWMLSKVLPKVFGDRPAPDGGNDEARRLKNGIAEMMRLIDGSSRGLPSEDESGDDTE
jgi:hypothetical protein